MLTQAEIDKQIKFEREAIAHGLHKLHKNTQALENKSYASATVYGASSIEVLLPKVVEYIEKTRLIKLSCGHGHLYDIITTYLPQLETLTSATISLKVTFDKVFSYKDKANQAQNVCDAIGRAIEDECQMRFYERTAPGLLHHLKTKYWHKSSGTQQKLTVIQTLWNRKDLEKWNCWGRANRVRVGAWLLDCIMQTSGWFEQLNVREGTKTLQYIVPTAAFMDVKDALMREAELFCPLAWPMLIPPNDWSNEQPGGYLLNEVMRGHDLVRRGHPVRIQGEKPLEFLNRIQKVSYCLNHFIVGVAEELDKREQPVGKFLPIIHHPEPPKPIDIEENKQSRQAYRRDSAEVKNRQAYEFRKSCRTRMTMEAVNRFKDTDKFYIPWSFDYRGRAYPIPAFLTPQDTDFGKSLLRSYEEAPMTLDAEEWLAFQVATCAGLDKATMKERRRWPGDNLTFIKRVVLDPIGTVNEWGELDEPWQFLAACEEYYRCVVTKERKTTGLFVATDATCSGLQILAGLARDKSTAQLVNVLPGSKPQDAYKVVAEQAKPYSPASIRPHMDRKVVKRVVMTVPYNAKPYSNRGYIKDALKEKGIEIDKDDLTKTVNAVRDAMNIVVPGPMAVMSWIEDEVGKAIDRGEKELTWVTPSGFVVTQRLMKKKITTLELQLMGRCDLKVAVGDKNEVDKRHHKNATAPNLIHSLDASLLHLSATKFTAPIALIHDSVLCRATDMSLLSVVVRETYMHLFAEHDYLNDFASQIGAETAPPIVGDLKPESVIESTYFFC